jgi:hypothetical protein
VALLFRRSAALILPNLMATLAMGIPGALFLAALALRAAEPIYLGLKLFSFYCVWMLLSWLAYCARRAFEDAQYRHSLAEIGKWLQMRGRERSLSFLLLLALSFWMGLALGFYQASAGQFWLASAALAVIGLLAYLMISATVLDLGLASRKEPHGLAEWKASFLMALAFAPQCLAALGILLLLSGAGAFLAGPQHWWGRLLWVPAFLLPIFSAAFAAAFVVALSDEFLARSHGVGPPAFEPFEFKELMRPWR